MSYFSDVEFSLAFTGSWREPQLGALGALISHFSLDDSEPPLVSIPTGTGKTAVALATPFVLTPKPKRVLIVEPSVDLRDQVVRESRTLKVLRTIGALEEDAPEPTVIEVVGRIEDWGALEPADIVVAHPNSISPAHYLDALPPSDLFDLVIFDEAHHLAAPTWKQIADHFKSARVLLLTATPFRRDKRRIPGRIVFHYPIRRALEEGLYHRVEPMLLPVAPGETRASIDRRIATRVISILGQGAHATSALIVRGASIPRAKELASLYAELGLAVEVLHSNLGGAKRAAIIAKLRSGEARAVAVVGMLGEGFDLPRLRVVAYHDKHRSTPSTIQLIGRLARVHPDYPQGSAMVVAQDADVFPELKAVVRELYEEDADWLRVLPGLIDDEVERIVADQEYADEFADSEGIVAPTLLTPLQRSSIYEVISSDWRPDLASVRSALAVGQQLRGNTIVYVGVSPDENMLVVGSRQTEQPRWTLDARLQNVQFGLTVISFRPPPRVGLPPLVLENSDSPKVLGALREVLEFDNRTRLLDPDGVSRYLDSLERISISSVGLRGERSYRHFMGRNVGNALRASDTAGAGLGHVMIQTPGEQNLSVTVGGATGKGKIWSNRYSSLRDYDAWIDEVVSRIWFSRIGATGPVLPGVRRGTRLVNWPQSVPVTADFAPELFGRGWTVHEANGEVIASLDDVSLSIPQAHWSTPQAGGSIPLQASMAGAEDEPFWEGALTLDGTVADTSGYGVHVRRGYSTVLGLGDFLTQASPVLNFLNGQRVEGRVVYDAQRTANTFSLSMLTSGDCWDGVDLTAETRQTAARRDNGMTSIHEAVEELIASRGRAGRQWVMCNDGKGEFADYVVIRDLRRGGVAVEFWHAKAAGGAPSVRITDLQVVIAQALRSRRYIPAVDFWQRVHKRLSQLESPHLELVPGSSSSELSLRARLGFDSARREEPWAGSWRRAQPKVQAKIVIVQPGLDRSRLIDELTARNPFGEADDIASLLAVFEDFSLAEGWDAEVVGT